MTISTDRRNELIEYVKRGKQYSGVPDFYTINVSKAAEGLRRLANDLRKSGDERMAGIYDQLSDTIQAVLDSQPFGTERPNASLQEIIDCYPQNASDFTVMHVKEYIAAVAKLKYEMPEETLMF